MCLLFLVPLALLKTALEGDCTYLTKSLAGKELMSFSGYIFSPQVLDEIN